MIDDRGVIRIYKVKLSDSLSHAVPLTAKREPLSLIFLFRILFNLQGCEGRRGESVEQAQQIYRVGGGINS